MRLRLYRIIAFLFLLSAISCNKKGAEELIICTQIPAIVSTQGLNNKLYPEQARIISFSQENPEESFTVLSEGFYSATSPDVVYTGDKLVFSGQKEQGEHWQIWEIDLVRFKTRQITREGSNCTDPMYLPTGEIVFSCQQVFGDTNYHVLFKSDSNGNKTQQISFHPHTDCSSTVLIDGRILYLSQQEFPEKKKKKLMVMRPDGTKVELLYLGNSGNTLQGRAWETMDKKIVFTEYDKVSNKTGLNTISYNSPFHSKQSIGNSDSIHYHSVYPLSEKTYLIAANSESNTSSLFLFNSETNTIETKLYTNDTYHTFEPIVNRVKSRARKLPSNVKMQQTAGLVLCQNVHRSGLQTKVKSPKDTTIIVELMGMEKRLGTSHPKKDGSVYLKVQADTPFQFRIKNEKGEVIYGPSDWLWVRPNERRGCVGCHMDRETVPRNYVPLAVKEPPVSLPAENMEEQK